MINFYCCLSFIILVIMSAIKLLLLLLLSTQVLGTLICGACQTSVSTFARVLSFIIPDYVAIDALDALCMRRCTLNYMQMIPKNSVNGSGKKSHRWLSPTSLKIMLILTKYVPLHVIAHSYFIILTLKFREFLKEDHPVL